MKKTMLVLLALVATSVMAAEAKKEAPKPPAQEWYSVHRQDGKVVASINPTARKVEWLGGKDEAMLSLFDWLSAQVSLSGELRKAYQECEASKAKKGGKG